MRHRLLSLLVVLLTVVGVAALAGCGSDDGDSGGGASATSAGTTASSDAPAGEPIRVMTIASIDTAGAANPNIAVTAEAYERWVNAHGGVAGRPLEVTVCDEHGKPADATACARKAVADKHTAVVGSFSFLGTNILPVLIKGRVPYFGECCAITPAEWTSDISFPIGNQPLWTVGLVKRAVEDKCERITEVLIDGAQGFQPLMDSAIRAYGRRFEKIVTIPAASQDYSPQVAEATSGDADCLLMIVPETQLTAWNVAFAQSGSDARLYGAQGNLNEVSTRGIPSSVVDGSVIAGSYPDISTEPWADYRQALEDADADPDLDYNSLGGLGTWAAYTAMARVMDGMSGPITSETFLDAVNHTTALDTGGMLPAIDFTKPWDASPPFRRLFNRTVVYSTIRDGKVVPLTTGFEDLSDLALGRAPAQ